MDDGAEGGAIIKLPACLTLLTLETYNLCFIASKLLTVADMINLNCTKKKFIE